MSNKAAPKPCTLFLVGEKVTSKSEVDALLSRVKQSVLSIEDHRIKFVYSLVNRSSREEVYIGTGQANRVYQRVTRNPDPCDNEDVIRLLYKYPDVIVLAAFESPVSRSNRFDSNIERFFKAVFVAQGITLLNRIDIRVPLGKFILKNDLIDRLK